MKHHLINTSVIIATVLSLITFVTKAQPHLYPNSETQDQTQTKSQALSYGDLNKLTRGSFVYSELNSDDVYEAPSLSSKVHFTINGLILRAELQQTFTNNTDQWIKGQYLFPLPDNAAVNELSMRVGERLIMGEIKEKQQAQRIYRNAVKTGKKATLLEQNRPNMFTAKLANIGPGEKITVNIGYQQVLNYQQGEFSFRFPMAITPRYSPKSFAVNNQDGAVSDNQIDSFALLSKPEKQKNKIDISIDLNAGFGLDLLQSTYHEIEKNELAYGKYWLNVSDEVMDKDFELKWRPHLNDSPQLAVFKEHYKNEDYGLVMLMPSEPMAGSNGNTSSYVASRELIFIIDTSGSMHGESLRQAKASLIKGLATLRQGDYFQVVEFNTNASQLFETSQLATVDNIKAATRFIYRLNADGGTNMDKALDLAFKTSMAEPDGRISQIVFITDGSVDNEAGLFKQINNDMGNKRLFTVGIGSAPNSYFMKRAAQIGRGTFTFIGNIKEVEQNMSLLFNKLSKPSLSQLSFKLADGGKVDFAPDTIPDAYAGEAIFVSYKLPANLNEGAVITGMFEGQHWQADINLGELTHEQEPQLGPNSVDERDESKAMIASLWARNKVKHLHQQVRLGEVANAKNQITDLGLRYHLVTEYTSLVAVEKKRSRPEGEAMVNKRYKSNRPAGARMPQTATAWQLQVLLGLLMMTLSVCVYFKQYNRKGV